MKLTFGEKVKYARERAGLTSEEFAKKIGVHQSFVSRIENNVRLPGHARIYKIAEVLNVPSEYFFSDKIHIIPDESIPPEYKEEAKKYVNYYEALDEAIDAEMTPEEVAEAIRFVKGIKGKK